MHAPALILRLQALFTNSLTKLYETIYWRDLRPLALMLRALIVFGYDLEAAPPILLGLGRLTTSAFTQS